MSNMTTIKVSQETKEELDLIMDYYAPVIAKMSGKRVNKINYDDLIRFLLKHAKLPEPSIILQKFRANQ